MNMEMKGLVFDIQGYSVHDGPGCRTLVFMKGCPLHCEWCSNPEGMHPQRELMFSNVMCVNRRNGCTRCLDACPHNAIVQNPADGSEAWQLNINRSLCSQCESQPCLSVCYFDGLRLCGKWYSIVEMMRVFERNRDYWGPGGGVSFSGGEPFLQYEFMSGLLEACHEKQITTAVETTAHIQSDKFMELMNWIDFAFIDIKHMDSQQHREKTGVGNELILRNIENLSKSNWRGRLVLCLPLIEGYNDTLENLEALGAFMQRLGLFELHLLPFHRLGESKWRQLGREYPYRQQSSTSEQKMNWVQDYFLAMRIACYSGADTPY